MDDKTKAIDTEARELQALPLENSLLSEQIIKDAERQFELRKKLLAVCVKALRPHDIQDFDGKPYIEGEGASRIMAVVGGFKVGLPAFNIDRIDAHYFVDCELPISFNGREIIALGDCSTSESFFCGKEGTTGKMAQYKKATGGNEQMAARMLLGDAKKKAVENATARGVTALLGIKGITWDELKEIGFSKSGAGSSTSFAKQTTDTLDATAASALAVGSKLNVKGKVTDIKSKQVGTDNKTVSGVVITDGKVSITVNVWAVVTEVKVGDEAFFANVKITEYNGSKQFTAETVAMFGL